MKKVLAEIRKLERKLTAAGKWVRQKSIPGTIMSGDTEQFTAQSKDGKWFEGYASDNGLWWLTEYPSKDAYDSERGYKSLGTGADGSISAAKHAVESLAKQHGMVDHGLK